MNGFSKSFYVYFKSTVSVPQTNFSYELFQYVTSSSETLTIMSKVTKVFSGRATIKIQLFWYPSEKAPAFSQTVNSWTRSEYNML